MKQVRPWTRDLIIKRVRRNYKTAKELGSVLQAWKVLFRKNREASVWKIIFPGICHYTRFDWLLYLSGQSKPSSELPRKLRGSVTLRPFPACRKGEKSRCFFVKTVGIVNLVNTKHRVFTVFPDFPHWLYRDKIVPTLKIQPGFCFGHNTSTLTCRPDWAAPRPLIF